MLKSGRKKWKKEEDIYEKRGEEWGGGTFASYLAHTPSLIVHITTIKRSRYYIYIKFEQQIARYIFLPTDWYKKGRRIEFAFLKHGTEFDSYHCSKNLFEKKRFYTWLWNRKVPVWFSNHPKRNERGRKTCPRRDHPAQRSRTRRTRWNLPILKEEPMRIL